MIQSDLSVRYLSIFKLQFYLHLQLEQEKTLRHLSRTRASDRVFQVVCICKDSGWSWGCGVALQCMLLVRFQLPRGEVSLSETLGL